MYADYPIYFDDVRIPMPQSGWSESSNVVENTEMSEGGTDMLDIIRMDKLSISVSTSCFSDVAKIYEEFSKKPNITVKFYDIMNETYQERLMRMRSFSKTYRKDTDKIEATNGIWDISFTLEEF